MTLCVDSIIVMLYDIKICIIRIVNRNRLRDIAPGVDTFLFIAPCQLP